MKVIEITRYYKSKKVEISYIDHNGELHDLIFNGTESIKKFRKYLTYANKLLKKKGKRK